MKIRISILIVCFVGAALYIANAPRAEAVVDRQLLKYLPMELGKWQGWDAAPLESKIVDALGVDDYLNRLYVSDGNIIGAYIGYYATQGTGDAIHSPMNCLPGAGWNPGERTRVQIDIPAGPGFPEPRSIEVNKVLIEKGLEKQIVLYWYQARGRVIASEYWGKIYLVLDAMQAQRSDAALVRVISPIKGQDGPAESAAQDAAIDFVQSAFPLLSRYLPE